MSLNIARQSFQLYVHDVGDINSILRTQNSEIFLLKTKVKIFGNMDKGSSVLMFSDLLQNEYFH